MFITQNAIRNTLFTAVVSSGLILTASASSLVVSQAAAGQPLGQPSATQSVAPQLTPKSAAPGSSLANPLSVQPQPIRQVPSLQSGKISLPNQQMGKRPPSAAPILTIMTPEAGKHLKMTSSENDKTFTRRIAFRVSMPMSASELGYSCCSISALNTPNAETIAATQEIQQFPVQKTSAGVPYYSYIIEVTLKQPITIKQRVAFKVMAAKNGAFDESTAQTVSFPVGGN